MASLKQSYVNGASDVPLIGETIGQFFDDACGKWASRPALVVRHQKVRLSYGELRNEVDKLAAGLLTLGLEPGDRIGIWSPNHSEWVLTQFATAKAGLILVNINPAYRVTELEYALNKVGCKALILAERFKSSDYVGDAARAGARARPRHAGKTRISAPAGLRSVILLGDTGIPARCSSLIFSSSRRRCGSLAHGRVGAAPAIRRSDQHPVHLRHHRLSQGRDADRTTTSSTTVTSSARRCA